MRERFTPVVTPARTESRELLPGPTLRESLGEKKFTSEQDLAINVLDNIDIPLENKRLLFFYHLWQETGSFGPIKEFGDIREDLIINSMLDTVMDNEQLIKEYDLFDKRHIYLKDNRQALDILNLRKNGYKNKQIAGVLKISESRVNTTTGDLVFLGLLNLNPHIKHFVESAWDFDEKVRRLRERNISNREIAQFLNVTETRVNRAANRFLRLGEINPYLSRKSRVLSIKEKNAVKATIKYLRTNTELTRKEIAHKLRISEHSVQYYLTMLQKQGEVPDKSEKANRQIKKEKLRKFLENLDPNIPVSLWKIKKDYFPNVDLSTLRFLHQEIYSEQAVPPALPARKLKYRNK